jgi:hypothetical protein
MSIDQHGDQDRICALTESLEGLIQADIRGFNDEPLGQEAICDVITLVAHEKPKSRPRRLWLNRIAPLPTTKNVEQTSEASEVKFVLRHRLIRLVRGKSQMEDPKTPVHRAVEGNIDLLVSGGRKMNVRVTVPLAMNLNSLMELVMSSIFGMSPPHTIHAKFLGGRYFTNDSGYAI